MESNEGQASQPLVKTLVHQSLKVTGQENAGQHFRQGLAFPFYCLEIKKPAIPTKTPLSRDNWVYFLS